MPVLFRAAAEPGVPEKMHRRPLALPSAGCRFAAFPLFVDASASDREAGSDSKAASVLRGMPTGGMLEEQALGIVGEKEVPAGPGGWSLPEGIGASRFLDRLIHLGVFQPCKGGMIILSDSEPADLSHRSVRCGTSEKLRSGVAAGSSREARRSARTVREGTVSGKGEGRRCRAVGETLRSGRLPASAAGPGEARHRATSASVLLPIAIEKRRARSCGSWQSATPIPIPSGGLPRAETSWRRSSVQGHGSQNARPQEFSQPEPQSGH